MTPRLGGSLRPPLTSSTYASLRIRPAADRTPWIPADELAEFNADIVGSIEVVAEFTT